MPTKNVCITLSPEAQEELAVKCKALGMNKSAFIELAVSMDFSTLSKQELSIRRANIVARRAVGLEIKGDPAEEVNDYYRGKGSTNKSTKLDEKKKLDIIDAVVNTPSEDLDVPEVNMMDTVVDNAIELNKKKRTVPSEESKEEPQPEPQQELQEESSDAEPTEEQPQAEPSDEPVTEPTDAPQERLDFLKPKKKKKSRPNVTV